MWSHRRAPSRVRPACHGCGIRHDTQRKEASSADLSSNQ